MQPAVLWTQCVSVPRATVHVPHATLDPWVKSTEAERLKTHHTNNPSLAGLLIGVWRGAYFGFVSFPVLESEAPNAPRNGTCHTIIHSLLSLPTKTRPLLPAARKRPVDLPCSYLTPSPPLHTTSSLPYQCDEINKSLIASSGGLIEFPTFFPTHSTFRSKERSREGGRLTRA